MKEFKLKFRGIRGSHPVCSENKLKYGGNTACVEVLVNGFLVILDAGTGVIEIGNDLIKSHISSGSDISNRTTMEATMLFSHSHIDHLQGLPFFKPLYNSKTKLNLFGAVTHGESFKDFISKSIFKLVFPVDFEDIPAEVNIENLNDNIAIILNKNSEFPRQVRFNREEELSVSDDEVVITTYTSLAHPKEGVNVFKIKFGGKTMVYATDKESYIGGDTKLINFARNADLLIHDSQYTVEDYISSVHPKQGYGHSTYEMAAEVAKLANVKQLVYYHIDPAYTDEFLDCLKEKTLGLFANSLIASENLEINLI